MAVVTCKYHPQIPARWRCDACQINFCPGCIKTPARSIPDCPVCKRELKSLGSGNLIKPFWARLREFFLYPLHPAPLLVMFALSIVAMLITYIPGGYLEVDILFWRFQRYDLFALPFYFVYLKYAQSVLEDTARGHLKPNPLTSERLTENGLIVFKLMMLFLVINLILFGVLDLFGLTVMNIVKFILVFALPAAVMLLFVEDNFFSAINPVTVGTLMVRVGTPYLFLFLLIYLLLLSKDFMTAILSGLSTPALSNAIYNFITMYFYLIVVNMMGYLLFQHHEQLGFEIDVDVESMPDRKKQIQEIEVSPELRAVEILIHEGKAEEAVKHLQGAIRNNPTDIEARERMLKLLRLTGDMELLRKEGSSYISYLISENKLAQAAKVYQSCVEYDKSFKPEKAHERLELGKFLRANAQPRLAMTVLNNLHKDFPSYDNVPQAYLLVAQMLCEKFNEDERARQVLDFVLQNYPAHPMADAVRDYRKIVEEVSNQKS